MSGASPSRGRWTERYPLTRLGLIGDLAAGLAVTGCAAALRHQIGDLIPPGLPFLTFLPAILLAAFVLGTRAGLFATVFSGVAAWYMFLPPFGSFTVNTPNIMAMGIFFFIAGSQVALIHWMQRTNRALLAEREANARLAETRGLLFRELQHRVSNNLQMVAALLSVQRRQVSDEAAGLALDEAARRLDTVGRISRQLYDPSGSGEQLGPFLDKLAHDVIATNARSKVSHRVISEGDARVSPEAAIPLALVVAETIANAIEHGFSDGQEDCALEIRLQPTADQGLRVEIEDNGVGLPLGFELKSSESLGLKIATMLAGQLGGRYTLAPAPGRGALARLELPLRAA